MDSTTLADWIPSSSSLPEGWDGYSSKTVLAFSPMLGIVFATYMRSLPSEGDCWLVKGVFGPCKITHWMHLPPLPIGVAP